MSNDLSLDKLQDSEKSINPIGYTIYSTMNPRQEDAQWLCDGIMDNAQTIKGHQAVEFFGFFLRDAQDELRGGLNGDILYGGMYISQLFIDKNLRLIGYGSQLMQKADAFAIEKQCNFISVNTMNFEALDFYKKHGFYIEFSRHGYKKNSVFHFMRKDLIVAEDIQSPEPGLPFEY